MAQSYWFKGKESEEKTESSAVVSDGSVLYDERRPYIDSLIVYSLFRFVYLISFYGPIKVGFSFDIIYHKMMMSRTKNFWI